MPINLQQFVKISDDLILISTWPVDWYIGSASLAKSTVIPMTEKKSWKFERYIVAYLRQEPKLPYLLKQNFCKPRPSVQPVFIYLQILNINKYIILCNITCNHVYIYKLYKSPRQPQLQVEPPSSFLLLLLIFVCKNN